MKNNASVIPEKFGIAWHPQLPAAKTEAEKVAEFLRRHTGNAPEVSPLNDPQFRAKILAKRFDMVITLGGDGTMLRTGKLCAVPEIPVMGINMGHLGFIIETVSDSWKERVLKLLSGEYEVDRRMMLHAERHCGDERIREWEVLNDAVVGRGNEFRPVHLRVKINYSVLEEIVADGLIVSTATGSTAYAMAASGPILPPNMRNMLLVPIAPHLCLDRTLVLPEDAIVEIQVNGYVDCSFCPDGIASFPLERGDEIIVRASKYSAKFVRFEEESAFYSKFVRKMLRRSVFDNFE